MKTKLIKMFIATPVTFMAGVGSYNYIQSMELGSIGSFFVSFLMVMCITMLVILPDGVFDEG